ncbi:hypothetical protein [Pedobacter punctiformis]|uniref:Uncharacterized protein n=1 Tax=Pedobacter punctiformis TaxID=3004097 RepID=A0ABT4LB82_9SPHI|nr:hypothetical protein [Pedobacter sp. HCMS5-2]MCZ4244967.1 hypothetical protein [Pedobacter sp. HCMS5-2]
MITHLNESTAIVVVPRWFTSISHIDESNIFYWSNEIHPSIWADQGHYQWVLSEPILYDKPILGVKGALGLWEWEKPYEVIGSAEMVAI